MDHDIEPPKMNISLPGMTDKEIYSLGFALGSKHEAFPVFVEWISRLLTDEVLRRREPGIEPAMLEIPTFSDDDLGEVLMACHVFNRLPLSESAHRFLDDVSLHVTSDAVARLQLYGGRTYAQ